MGISLRRHDGFTIVELLIVVVVIAILAAITIVAFNGVQNRAKDSAAQSTASQASKRINVVAVTGDETFPPNKTAMLAATGMQENGNVTYQYTASSDFKSYCLTSTTGTISYYTTNTNLKPSLGGCPGHGVGGLPPVTNYFLDPNFSGGSGTANQSGVTPAITTYQGSSMAQATTTTTSDASIRLQGAASRWTIGPGQTVYATGTVYNAAASARNFTLNVRFYDASGATLGTQLAIVNSSAQVINSGASYTFTVSTIAPASTASVGVNANRTSGTGAAIGDVYYVDNIYLSDTVSGYADGNSTNWVWNDVPNNSTSTGPRI